MTETKLNRNGAGYYDETAYKALSGMAKPGEIWTFENKGKEEEALIIKNHGNVCTVLMLTDDFNKKCIQVMGRKAKWTDPRLLRFLFNDRLAQFVKALPDGEFSEVLDELEVVFGISIDRKAVK